MIPSDIEIAQIAKMRPIHNIATEWGILDDEIELYGKYKAKISFEAMKRLENKPNGKLILVTAITPTPAGEGKSTTTIGLGQALNKIGKKTVIALREPSLGPVFGVKGGAAGGGYSQVVPMEDINLHFTGDMHAITTANNLISAMIDAHIANGNELRIDPRQITWKRVMDMNDRALRQIVVGLGGTANGFVREDNFIITVASEIMAILCLADGLMDLKERIAKIVFGYDLDNKPLTVADLKVQGAVAMLLKDAIKPNMVQTLEHTPALIHGGPFANIAHGCNSLTATKLGLKMGDYLVTEAGFAADLGAEKFFDIKCREGNLKPDGVVIVATIRALKMHGGVDKKDLSSENLTALENGFANLKKHMENLQKFGVPALVAINKFSSDTKAEIEKLIELCSKEGFRISLNECWEKGGEGGMEMAMQVVDMIENNKSDFHFLYDVNDSIEHKIHKLVVDYYGGKGVVFSPAAKTTIKKLEKMGMDKLPICMAKTQFSFSDNPKKIGVAKDFEITIREIKLSAGAGFLVCIAGDIMIMPGLGKEPAALAMDIDEKGNIKGLF